VGSRPGPSDAQLRVALESLSARLDDPSAPDLVARVRARLESESRATPPRRMTRYAFAGVAVAVAVSMVLAFSPGTRRAVAGWLGLRGIHIERAVPPPTAVGGELDLGAPVTLVEAERQTDFDVLLPRGFGLPHEVYLAENPKGGRVDLLYRPRRDLPPAAASGVGMLLTEFRADTRTEIISKRVGPDVRVEPVTVAGNNGVWLEGGTHTLTYTDDRGRSFEDRTRLAGNTLIWERGPLTLRLESGLSKEDAIRVAASMSRASPS
jgi:hypothetical protein